MTPDDEHPTVEEWIAASQACCGIGPFDDDDDDDDDVPPPPQPPEP